VAVLSTIDQVTLRVQEAVSQALILLTYASLVAWMRLQRYRIPDLDAVRADFEARVGHERGPLLICANHLTLIDSLVIQWAIAPAWRLALRPGLFTWNLPDRYNLSRRLWVRVLGYVGKCIPVIRKATPEETRSTLDKVAFLLARGQAVLVFPEGGRTRIGRVDTENFSYGVGRMLQESPGARVLCVFARGVGQQAFSDYPRRGERFIVRLRRIGPATTFQGMRGARDLATQIVTTLREMEIEAFDAPVDR
jgi:1-acyl-sn-glycerol-3-phosphate acyltransferase